MTSAISPLSFILTASLKLSSKEKPTKPEEPTEPTEPTKPVEPAEPIEPVEPVEPRLTPVDFTLPTDTPPEEEPKVTISELKKMVKNAIREVKNDLKNKNKR